MRPRYLTPREFADIYGFHFKTIENWVRRNKLAGVLKINGRWRIPDPGYEYAMRMRQGPMVLARDIPMFRRGHVAKLVHRSNWTIKQWRRTGRLQGVMILDRYLYSISDIERALAAGKKSGPRGVVERSRAGLLEWGRKELAKGPPKLPPNPLDNV